MTTPSATTIYAAVAFGGLFTHTCIGGSGCECICEIVPFVCACVRASEAACACEAMLLVWLGNFAQLVLQCAAPHVPIFRVRAVPCRALPSLPVAFRRF